MTAGPEAGQRGGVIAWGEHPGIWELHATRAMLRTRSTGDSMDAKLLIDAIVQQTTVLIAHLSTSAGLRAPLAHVAD